MAEARIPVPESQIADFCRRNQIRNLSLFGSVLRDDFGPDSDADVLVEFEPEAQVGFLALSRMQREPSQLFQRPVPHDAVTSLFLFLPPILNVGQSVTDVPPPPALHLERHAPGTQGTRKVVRASPGEGWSGWLGLSLGKLA